MKRLEYRPVLNVVSILRAVVNYREAVVEDECVMPTASAFAELSSAKQKRPSHPRYVERWSVAPRAGAWIETRNGAYGERETRCRALAVEGGRDGVAGVSIHQPRASLPVIDHNSFNSGDG